MITSEEMTVRRKVKNNKKSFIFFTTLSIVTGFIADTPASLGCFILLIIPVINVIRIEQLWSNFYDC